MPFDLPIWAVYLGLFWMFMFPIFVESIWKAAKVEYKKGKLNHSLWKVRTGVIALALVWPITLVASLFYKFDD